MQQSELETFLAVAEAESFTLAAGQFNLTQPAISKRIAQLEERLGARLFDRVGRRVLLTDAGRLLLPNARRILLEIAETERLLSLQQDTVGGTLKVTTSHHIGLHRLAPALRRFNRRHQAVRLALRFEDSETGYELVRQGQTELAVVTLNPAGDKELHAEPLWADPLVFCAANDHPLVNLAKVSLADLAEHAAVLPGIDTYTGKILSEHFQQAGIPMPDGLATNYLETIGMLVASGLGWSLLPATMVGNRLRILPLDTRALTRTLGMVVHPRRTLSRAAEAFMRNLRRYGDGAKASSR